MNGSVDFSDSFSAWLEMLKYIEPLNFNGIRPGRLPNGPLSKFLIFLMLFSFIRGMGAESVSADNNAFREDTSLASGPNFNDGPSIQYHAVEKCPDEKETTPIDKKKPEGQSTNKLKAIKRELNSRMTLSEKAEKYYTSHPDKSSKNDLKKLRKAILEILTNPEIFCRFQSILKDSTFKIELCSPNEIKPRAEYDRFKNTIKIPFHKEIYPTYPLATFIEHESWHAFVNYENRDQNRIFYHAKTKEIEPNSAPCFPLPKHPGMIECSKIKIIQDAGLEKAKKNIISFRNILFHI